MRRLLALLVLLVLPLPVQAACTTANMAVSGAGNVPPRYGRCAAYADAPPSGLTVGDTLFITGTGASYTATSATTWTQQAGALPLPNTALANSTVTLNAGPSTGLTAPGPM